MTEIDLTKSKILVQLLKYMVDGMGRLSSHDPALRQISSKIRSHIFQPHHVFGEELVGTIDRAKDIVSGYDIKVHEGHTPGNEITALPGILYNARTETENLISTKKLEHPEILQQDQPKIAKLIEDVNKFYLLTVGKDDN